MERNKSVVGKYKHKRNKAYRIRMAKVIKMVPLES